MLKLTHFFKKWNAENNCRNVKDCGNIMLCYVML